MVCRHSRQRKNNCPGTTDPCCDCDNPGPKLLHCFQLHTLWRPWGGGSPNSSYYPQEFEKEFSGICVSCFPRNSSCTWRRWARGEMAYSFRQRLKFLELLRRGCDSKERSWHIPALGWMARIWNENCHLVIQIGNKRKPMFLERMGGKFGEWSLCGHSDWRSSFLPLRVASLSRTQELASLLHGVLERIWELMNISTCTLGGLQRVIAMIAIFITTNECWQLVINTFKLFLLSSYACWFRLSSSTTN